MCIFIYILIRKLGHHVIPVLDSRLCKYVPKYLTGSAQFL